MREKYEPTRREVVREMARSLKVSRANLKSLKNIAMDFVASATSTAFALYIIPKVARCIRSKEDSSNSEEVDFSSDIQEIGLYAGFITGVVSWSAQTAAYSYAARNGHSEALLIPVATNVASGVYEIGRFMYNRARDRLLERHACAPSGLENRVDEH